MNRKTKEFGKDSGGPIVTDERDRMAKTAPMVDHTTGDRFYGTWWPPEIDQNPTDTYYQVTPGKEQALDLISFIQFGTTKLDWLIHEVNKANEAVPRLSADPVPSGTVLRMPGQTSLIKYLTTPSED